MSTNADTINLPKRQKLTENNDYKPLPDTSSAIPVSTPDANVFKVGSRKSELALIQTKWVIAELKKLYPTHHFETITMTTIGDRILNQALSKIGEKNLFTKELEIALEKKEVDFVVHSLKDLPTTLPDGMVIGAVCEREDPSDAVVIKKGFKEPRLDCLEPGSVVGTSSVRRVAQLSSLHPHLIFRSIRGNLNTRLRKLDDGTDYSAIVLAAAGLKRMGWENRISHLLPSNQCLNAVGQGALAVECRDDDLQTLELLSKLASEKTSLECVAERAFMKCLGGGCSAPIAVSTNLDSDFRLEMSGGVFSLDGTKKIISSKMVDLKLVKKLDNESVLSGNSSSKIHNDLDNGSWSSNNNYVRDLKFKKIYSGIASNENIESFSIRLSKAEEFGQSLADEFTKLGAKEILDEARVQNGST